MYVNFLDGQMVIFLEVSAEDYKATVNSFLDLLYRRLDHLLPDVELTWAIGDAAIEPIDLQLVLQKQNRHCN